MPPLCNMKKAKFLFTSIVDSEWKLENKTWTRLTARLEVDLTGFKIALKNVFNKKQSFIC